MLQTRSVVLSSCVAKRESTGDKGRPLGQESRRTTTTTIIGAPGIKGIENSFLSWDIACCWYGERSHKAWGVREEVLQAPGGLREMIWKGVGFVYMLHVWGLFFSHYYPPSIPLARRAWSLLPGFSSSKAEPRFWADWSKTLALRHSLILSSQECLFKCAPAQCNYPILQPTDPNAGDSSPLDKLNLLQSPTSADLILFHHLFSFIIFLVLIAEGCN